MVQLFHLEQEAEMDRIRILNTDFDALSPESAVKSAFDGIMAHRSGSEPFSVFTPNPLIVMEAYGDAEFAEVLNNASLSLADGWGVVKASRRLGTPLPCRCGGIDVAEKLLSLLAEEGGSVYILGSRPGVAQKAVEALTLKYPGLRSAGFRDGYFGPEDASEVCAEICKAAPDFLCVCLGSPKQEKFISDNLSTLGCGCAMGLGGAADVWSGRIKRAPSLFLKLKLEWLWRMFAEPRRFLQIPKLVRFVFLTKTSKNTQNRAK